MQKENNMPIENHQYVGPYRLEKTLGKGQTGKWNFLTECLLVRMIFGGCDSLIQNGDFI